MTLIIKELIIKGVVTTNSTNHSDDLIVKKELLKYLSQMKKELKKDCVETVLSKLESSKIR